MVNDVERGFFIATTTKTTYHISHKRYRYMEVLKYKEYMMQRILGIGCTKGIRNKKVSDTKGI